MTPRIPVSKIGCWLDGHLGWHNQYGVIDVARKEWGYELPQEDADFVKEWKRWRGYDMPAAERAAFEADCNEEYIETLVERATAYLDSLAPEGTEFCWDMGELSLLCKCQIEGNPEYDALMENGTNHCGAGWHR